ncbi:MAG: hypothetical protein AAFS06_05235 [Cyanobacteria bacterium J06631_12]
MVSNNDKKSPLASETIWGVTLLTLLNIADILTGSPWSWNGAVKWTALILGCYLGLRGRWRASKRLSWRPLLDWLRKPVSDEFWDVPED